MPAKKETTTKKRTVAPKVEHKMYTVVNTDTEKTTYEEIMAYIDGDESFFVDKKDALSNADSDYTYNYLIEVTLGVVKANKTEPQEDNFKVITLK